MTTIKFARTVPARTAVVAKLVPQEQLKATGVDRKLLQRLQFSGGSKDSATITGDAPAVTVLVGLGPSADLDAAGIRRAAAQAVRSLASHRSVVLDLSLIDAAEDEAVGEGGDARLAGHAIGQAAAEGAALAAYRFERFKSPTEATVTESITIAGLDSAKAGVARGQVIADAVCFARDLVNEPGGSLTPVRFAELAAERASAAGLTVQVLDEDAIEAERLGGVMAVNRGSSLPPRFVKLTYTPPAGDESPLGSVALVGKGITFDSGGLSIKPADGMMTMKCDMGGAAAVIATMCALPALGVKVPVTSYTPLTDNMLGADATRPGDVMTARNGKTVEILNTDAEGRLVLADALSLASEDGHTAIVDLATLTGACMVALGDKIAGLLGNDADLINEIDAAAERSGEMVWHLPLPSGYRKLIDSPIADMKNIGGRYGGTLTAGLFLQEFVDPDIAWVHLDIAGPAFSEEVDAEVPKGGTGFGVRTLIEWLEGRTV